MSTNISQSSESQNLTQQKTERLLLSVRKGWTPPPRISVPQWADDYRKLAKEAGSTSGKWETSTVEVARGPMLAATESGVHIITVMCCTQLMKTALLENLLGILHTLIHVQFCFCSRKKKLQSSSQKNVLALWSELRRCFVKSSAIQNRKAQKKPSFINLLPAAFWLSLVLVVPITSHADQSAYSWRMRCKRRLSTVWQILIFLRG